MKQWVLILGCSTGHGGATARKLAEDGYGIIGFHFDRGDIKKEAEEFCEELKGLNDGCAYFFNKNAADSEVYRWQPADTGASFHCLWYNHQFLRRASRYPKTDGYDGSCHGDITSLLGPETV